MQEFKDLQHYPIETLSTLDARNYVSLDTETLGATKETNIPFYWSWKANRLGTGAAPMITKKGFDWCKRICAHPSRKIFHNMKFDLNVLERAGFNDVKGEFEDTILMHMLFLKNLL